MNDNTGALRRLINAKLVVPLRTAKPDGLNQGGKKTSKALGYRTGFLWTRPKQTHPIVKFSLNGVSSQNRLSFKTLSHLDVLN